MLKCIVELGKHSIITRVSLLLSHLDFPCEGFLEAIFCMFAYLKIRHNARLVSYLSYIMIDMDQFEYHDGKQLYGDVKEDILPDDPLDRGK